MESKDAVVALAALAQATRLAIFRQLVRAGPDGLSVGRIAESVAASPPTLSFHLKELSRAGLIGARQQGRFVFYSATFPRMNELLSYLTEHCCDGDAARCFPTAVKGPGSARLDRAKRAGARSGTSRR